MLLSAPGVHPPTAQHPDPLNASSTCVFSTGIRFIFGLNFHQQNISLAKQQMDAILAHLPREAILAFEVGNEVRL
jgi:hypothetical protein